MLYHIDYEDKPQDNCGVFGIFNHLNAAPLTERALFGLQHRGEESAGIAVGTTKDLTLYKGVGLVNEVFDHPMAPRLRGSRAIGHVRYSLIGEPTTENAQPFVCDRKHSADQTHRGETPQYTKTFHQTYNKSPIAILQNGNFTGGLERLCDDGSDTKNFTACVSKSGESNLRKAIVEQLKKAEGSWALVGLTPNMLIGARDPHGYRPLSLGRIDNSYVLASESCAFNDIGAEFIRELAPGEILFIDNKGLNSKFITPKIPRKECIFEHIYLARPDSFIFGKSVSRYRKEIGQQLAREDLARGPINADLVVGIPDAGNLYAMGYAKEAGIEYSSEALKRSHYYPGRTFIKKDHAERKKGADRKFFAVPDEVRGKSIVLVDDSLVRGVNIEAAARKLKAAGAKEVHVRIASPPYISACHWGVDTYDVGKLIARNAPLAERINKWKIDSLEYLSLDGMLSAFPNPQDKCLYCFERH